MLAYVILLDFISSKMGLIIFPKALTVVNALKFFCLLGLTFFIFSAYKVLVIKNCTKYFL